MARWTRWWLLLLAAVAVRADVKLPAILTDHMVVQRDRPVHVWGEAAPGEAVAVSFRGAEASGPADELGRWSLYLPAGAAGGPFELTVRGGSTIVLRDVLVGDVWLASGQSNMELALRQAADPGQEIAKSDCAAIRLLQVLPRPSGYPREDFAPAEVRGWAPCRPETAAGFSAVAYHFAREINASVGVPIGIIQSCWGGTPAEAWTSYAALAADAALQPVFQYRAQVVAQRADFLRGRALAQQAYDRAVVEGRAAGLTDPAQEWHPDFEGWAPGALYNGMIAPLTHFPLKGVIWYQGESNSEPRQFPIYERLFATLIADWRQAWKQGDFPFLYVQLANFAHPLPEWNWPEVREAQRRALRVANTAMAVAIDVGEENEIHPKNKREVGRRLALAARSLAYGESLEYSGPLFHQAVAEGAAMRVIFTRADGGLVSRGATLTGFEVAAADGQFVPATGTIDGSSVVVSSPAVVAPRAVRYGWANDPGCNLVNRAGLPASPFTTRE